MVTVVNTAFNFFMCGINGFTWPDYNLIEKMNDRLIHRGPDQSGKFVDDHISLGSRRLAILDTSQAGQMPLRRGNLVITYNGELYNFKEIKRTLEKAGCQFTTNTDTEVVLRSYQYWGSTCLNKFIGIFAFAIYNAATHELFLARDQVGVKPLYYWTNERSLVFSSEIKAMLEHDIKPRVNAAGLTYLMTVLYVPEPQTMFTDIFKLPAGHYAYWRDNKLTIEKYWEVSTQTETTSTIREIKAQINHTLTAAVQAQLISDRPLGVYLSGGWDSSTILAIMRDLGVSNIKTFSSGFEVRNDKYNADFQLAGKTARYFKTEHHESILSSREVAELLPQAVYHLEEPNAAPTILPMFKLAAAAKHKVVVVLSGDGGDELWGGYHRYKQSYWLDQFQKIPKSIRQLLPYTGLELFTGKRQLRQKLNTGPGLDRFALFKVYPDDYVRSIIKAPAYQPGLVRNHFANFFPPDLDTDSVRQLMYTDIKNWLVAESLNKTDKMSMAHSLEQRVPMLDIRLVELASKIPSKYKIHHGLSKWIFKQAVGKYIPPHLKKQPKRGWLTPGALWLRHELNELCQSAFQDNWHELSSSYLNLARLRQLHSEHVSGKGYHMNQLWAGLTFQLWLKTFFK